MAILIEHLGGKWPLWLSPRQVKICPISSAHNDYAKSIHKSLEDLGWHVELDISDTSLNKKVRTGQVKQFNYIVVVGDEEIQSGTVDVRSARSNQRLDKMTVSEFHEFLSVQCPGGEKFKSEEE